MPKKIFNILIYIFAFIGLFFTVGYFAVKYGITNTDGVVDKQRQVFLDNGKNTASVVDSQNKKYVWNSDSEWQTLKNAILKDKSVIYRASAVSGVSPRLIVSNLVVEQLRFYHTDRESFKKFFEPLKILGSQTQFSWGVMGTKEETAIQIEKNLKDKTSPYYLGANFEHLLDFNTIDIKQERFTRMTDQHDHYYSYLYAGLYLKQVITQWNKAGFDISNRPDILATLYNIGFKGSKPNADPKSGGAEIKIGNTSFSFGSLSAEFYNSNELLEEFPR